MNGVLSKVIDFFDSLNKDTLFLIDEFYDPSVHFISPLAEFSSRNDLKEYYASIYHHLIAVHFDFVEKVERGGMVLVIWKMNFRSKLNGGQLVVVDGASHIKFGGKEGKVIYQRDIYDMGGFVYESIPILGSVIRFIKKQFYPFSDRSFYEQDI